MNKTKRHSQIAPEKTSRRARLHLIYALLLTTLLASIARAADSTVDPALTTRVAAVFEAKCAQCHSPTAKKVKKFDTIFDVPKLIASPKKLLLPKDPDKSAIYTSIVEDEMPPEDSKVAKVTSTELADIKAWIEAGCPALVRPVSDSAATQPTVAVVGQTDDPAGPVKSVKPYSYRLVRFFGHFHPLVVHFPIALLMVAAFAEVLFLRRKNEALTSTIRMTVALGAAGAFVSAALGWIAAYHLDGTKPPSFGEWFAIFGQLVDRKGGVKPDPLVLHAWLGTMAALWSVLVAMLSEKGIRRAAANAWTGRSRIVFGLVLFLGVALTGLAAHIGGELVHGEEYLQLPMP